MMLFFESSTIVFTLLSVLLNVNPLTYTTALAVTLSVALYSVYPAGFMNVILAFCNVKFLFLMFDATISVMLSCITLLLDVPSSLKKL